MTDENKIDDFIQQAVNRGYQQSVERAKKRIAYRMQQANCKRNKLKVKRKVERQNRKKARLKY